MIFIKIHIGLYLMFGSYFKPTVVLIVDLYRDKVNHYLTNGYLRFINFDKSSISDPQLHVDSFYKFICDSITFASNDALSLQNGLYSNKHSKSWFNREMLDIKSKLIELRDLINKNSTPIDLKKGVHLRRMFLFN
ncbi:hypothetical protein BpHYR1_019823 [Brachionus plicatilis]|uniref:Uncharacterized protein n=1 Tax=Brachionus plicatilis TaxID=10195 RepID=A0A3M7QMQ5_BRAPC|nr:hypothetical protein BpHYR1_019823 [Brachionus plicatilis]